MYFESYIYHIITITNWKYQLVDAIQITDGEKVKITIIKVELEDEDRMKSICSVYSINLICQLHVKVMFYWTNFYLWINNLNV